MRKIIVLLAFALLSIYIVRGDFYVYEGDTIQEVIDNASNGDTIFVSGYHNESIFINKSISIIGRENAFIYAIEIDADNVIIMNISINKILINGSNCNISYNLVNQQGIICNGNNNTIYHNFVMDCYAGIIINGSGNRIISNGIQNNENGIICNGNNNTIYHNNFNNTINAIDNDNNTWNSTSVNEGNYWNDYNGSDENGDGIGDLPYSINSSYDYYPLIHPYDIYPPVTNCTILLNGTTNNGWYIGNVTIILKAIDESGVSSTFYRINGGTWTEYEEEFTITEDGMYLIEFYSIDNRNNIEEKKNVTLKIDKNPPSINYSFFPPNPTGKNGWYNTSVEVSVTADDEFLDGVYYKIDNGTWHPYEGYPFIPDGMHTLYFKAVDEAGNSNIKSANINIDTHSPYVKIKKPDGGYVKGIYNIVYNATDNVDEDLDGNISIYYSYDNGTTWNIIDEGINNTGLYEWNTNLFNDSAQAILKIVAIDDAGNAGINISNKFILDNIPPQINITSPKSGEAFGKNETIDITWEAYDDVDPDLNGGIYIFYEYDGKWYYVVNQTDNDGEYLLPTTGMKDGEYRIKIVAIDDAGNAGISTTGNFTVDRTPPSVYISKPLKGFMYINIFGRELLPALPLPGFLYNAVIVGKIKVEIDVKDDYSGIQRVIISTDEVNGVPVEKPYTWTWNPSFGTHYLKAIAWDNAGNTNSYEIDKILCINI